jgi:hypothetical protein
MAAQNAPVLREGLRSSLVDVVTLGLTSYQEQLFQFLFACKEEKSLYKEKV